MYPISRNISDLDPDEQFVLRDGRVVYIDTNEHDASAEIYDANGNPIGAFRFQQIEGPEDGDYWHHLTWQYLDAQPGYKRLGIGREILMRVRLQWDTTITAGESDGSTNNFGDHLDGEGACFVSAMREAGLIQRSTYDAEPEDDWGNE